MKGNTFHVYNNVNEFPKLCAKNPDVRKREAAVNDSDKTFGIALGRRQRSHLDRHGGSFGMMEIYILIVHILYLS